MNVEEIRRFLVRLFCTISGERTRRRSPQGLFSCFFLLDLFVYFFVLLGIHLSASFRPNEFGDVRTAPSSQRSDGRPALVPFPLRNVARPPFLFLPWVTRGRNVSPLWNSLLFSFEAIRVTTRGVCVNRKQDSNFARTKG